MRKVTSPILFLIFNRPVETKLVFAEIKKVRPARLYIAADGPRANHITDELLCSASKEILKGIDWDCELYTLFRKENYGCKAAVSSAISWFFENEAEGIILEDDCLPNAQFFEFCENLLEKYRFDTRIRHISGSSMAVDYKPARETYHFSKMSNVWGWASWRRVWNDYDADLNKLNKFIESSLYKNVFQDAIVSKHLLEKFLLTYQKKIDTWDYQYAFCNIINNGLSIQPNYNLISNIGFNEFATHTTDTRNQFANRPLESYKELIHPVIIVPDTAKDIIQIKMQIPSAYFTYVQKIKNFFS